MRMKTSSLKLAGSALFSPWGVDECRSLLGCVRKLGQDQWLVNTVLIRCIWGILGV